MAQTYYGIFTMASTRLTLFTTLAANSLYSFSWFVRNILMNLFTRYSVDTFRHMSHDNALVALALFAQNSSTLRASFLIKINEEHLKVKSYKFEIPDRLLSAGVPKNLFSISYI